MPPTWNTSFVKGETNSSAYLAILQHIRFSKLLTFHVCIYSSMPSTTYFHMYTIYEGIYTLWKAGLTDHEIVPLTTARIEILHSTCLQ